MTELGEICYFFIIYVAQIWVFYSKKPLLLTLWSNFYALGPIMSSFLP